MIKINDLERREILKSHLAQKIKLNEQQTALPTPGSLKVTPATLGDKILTQQICFCKADVAKCGAVYNTNGVFTIQATMKNDSQQQTPSGQPIYKAGNVVTFNLNDYTYIAPSSSTKHTWRCSALSGSITEIRNEMVGFYITKMGYNTIDTIPNELRANINDPNKYIQLDLSLMYPFLYPKWESIDNTYKFLYKPKSKTFQVKSNSYPETPEEKSRIESLKQKNPRLKTMEDVLNDEGIRDFSVISDKYTPYQIGNETDNVFGREFYLYYKNTGQNAAKKSVDIVKNAMQELNISKNTCAKLINNYYEAYKVNQTNMDLTKFDTIKTQVTYCARKYDNFGLLGGDKIDEKLDTLKGLSSNNKFKIKIQ